MPQEVHEHYDNEGVRTGYTVVTRESAWDDASRERALALTVYEDGTCGCGCGLSMAEAHDPAQAWIVDKFTCYAGRALRQIERQEADQAETARSPDGWADGLHYFVRPVNND